MQGMCFEDRSQCIPESGARILPVITEEYTLLPCLFPTRHRHDTGTTQAWHSRDTSMFVRADFHVRLEAWLEEAPSGAGVYTSLLAFVLTGLKYIQQCLFQSSCHLNMLTQIVCTPILLFKVSLGPKPPWVEKRTQLSSLVWDIALTTEPGWWLLV